MKTQLSQFALVVAFGLAFSASLFLSGCVLNTLVNAEKYCTDKSLELYPDNEKAADRFYDKCMDDKTLKRRSP